MGKGNWIPCTPAREHNRNSFQGLLYLSLFPRTETPDADEVEMAYENLYEFLDSVLDTVKKEGITEFEKATRSESDGFLASAHGSRDSLVLFHSEQLLIIRDMDGDWDHQGIGVVVKESVYFEDDGDHDKDPGDAEEVAEKVFGLLAKAFRLAWNGDDDYRVSLWSSTWTTSRLKEVKYSEFTQWELECLSEHWLNERVDQLRSAQGSVM